MKTRRWLRVIGLITVRRKSQLSTGAAVARRSCRRAALPAIDRGLRDQDPPRDARSAGSKPIGCGPSAATLCPTCAAR